MIVGTATERPMVLALVGGDRQVVDAGDAPPHQALGVELPVLVAVAAKPVAAVVVPFVGEAHRDAVAGECPHFLDQAVVELALPFARQERHDLVAAVQEFGAVAPPAVGRVGERDARRIARVPGVLGHARLLRGRFGGERRKRRSAHGHAPRSGVERRASPRVVRAWDAWEKAGCRSVRATPGLGPLAGSCRGSAQLTRAALEAARIPPIVRADPGGRPARFPLATRGLGNMPKGDIKKVVLAYSGGLDTSIILKWLQTTYGCEVVTFTADLGQGEELGPARDKALLLGIRPEHVFIEDLREEFVRDYVFPMFRANALYEGQYLLGTSIARPLIAKKQIEIAERVGADAVAHGATGKGNDQVRFELTYYALKPDVTVIAPWREWDLTSRSKLIEFAEKHQIPIAKDKRGEAPFSVDANLLHTSSEGKVLEDPSHEVPDYVFSRTVDPEDAPDQPTYITVDFEGGDAVAIDGKKLSPAALLTRLNELGRANGIGRLDLVENRFVGMKSRGMYETPGGTILLAAHRGIESITLDRGAMHLKDELMPKYAELVYYGFWFTPEREMLQ